ncbi:MAG: site-specific DNA-methyltransferase, partial [Proteobacteria bacterium]|nr:site-specific DNA-methyltransferase [Pseudomonadota bacterium]
MSKINLTEEELAKLLEAVNGGFEPPREIAWKLFPSLAEEIRLKGEFDFSSLNRIKIPTIEYKSKRPEGYILASANLLGQSAPLQVVRRFGEPGEDGWQNLIIQGDNLQFLKTVYLNQDPLVKDKVKGKVKLIYIDPPFATKSDFQGGDGTKSYSDKINTAEFLENLRERLIFMREALAEDGSIYVHCDWRMNSHIRLVLEEVFGTDQNRAEIIWKRASAHSDSAAFGQVHECILYFSKGKKTVWNAPLTDYEEWYVERYYRYSDEDGRKFMSGDISAKGLSGGGYRYTWKGCEGLWRCPESKMRELDEAGRVYYTQNGIPRFKRFLDEMEGRPVQSLWDDIQSVVSWAQEKEEYPTQKPEALLER